MSEPVPGDRLPSLGRRGGGWVAGQGALGVAVVAAGLAGPSWPAWLRAVRVLTGLVLAGAGVTMGAAGARALGRSLTPFPKPHEAAELAERGVYRFVRHPIYGGAIAASFGWSLLTKPFALLPSAALAAFLELKSRREEAWLAERYAGYAEYRRRVRWRLVPFVR